MLERINSRLDDTEGQISELEDSSRDHPIWTKKKEKEKINEDHGRDLWDNIKDSTTCIREVPKEEETDKEAENVFEDIISFSNPGKETDIQKRSHIVSHTR